MRRFFLFLAVAGLLGLFPLHEAGSQAWAQGRSRSSRARSRARKAAATPTPRVPEPSPKAVDPVTGDSSNASAPPPSRGPARIDFDDRLIQGQTNKAGAVYLYDRKELETRSMIRERESFRSEILSTVYDQ